MNIKFGSYIDRDIGRWQFSLGFTLWPVNYCSCHKWCLIIELGLWYIEFGSLKSREDTEILKRIGG